MKNQNENDNYFILMECQKLIKKGKYIKAFLNMKKYLSEFKIEP